MEGTPTWFHAAIPKEIAKFTSVIEKRQTFLQELSAESPRAPEADPVAKQPNSPPPSSNAPRLPATPSCGCTPSRSLPPSSQALAEVDARQRPPRWKLSPWAVKTYLLGGTLDNGFEVTPKYIGNERLIEIAIATLATDRRSCSYGVPGTAKSWVSEHLAAAISGTSTLLVQGTAGHRRGDLALRLELRPAAGRRPVARRPGRPARCSRPWKPARSAASKS